MRQIAFGEAEVHRSLEAFLGGDEGATAVEYALMAGLIALAIVSGLTNIGIKLSGYFSEVSSAMK
jgi:pilus assembly protein Flp/PilA